MAVDARKDPATRPGALARIGGQLGINPETLRNWLTQAEIDAGSQPGTTTTDAERLTELEREVKELRRANVHLEVRVGLLRSGARPPQSLIIDYVDQHKDSFGVEPICTAFTSADVKIAPSTYYASNKRPTSARAVRDEELKVEIGRVHKENYGVYGIRKIHAQLGREGVTGCGDRPVARCTTQRLMKDLGLRGISRAEGPRTTVPGTAPDTRPDLVEREFVADPPDRLWVADITYCRTFAGCVYAAFVKISSRDEDEDCGRSGHAGCSHADHRQHEHDDLSLLPATRRFAGSGCVSGLLSVQLLELGLDRPQLPQLMLQRNIDDRTVGIRVAGHAAQGLTRKR
jgi:putative transposase